MARCWLCSRRMYLCCGRFLQACIARLELSGVEGFSRRMLSLAARLERNDPLFGEDDAGRLLCLVDERIVVHPGKKETGGRLS